MFDMKYSIDDLIVETETGTKGVASWDGVRNFLARNIMRSMKKGDKAFFYHSNAKPSGIVGIVEVVREAYSLTHLLFFQLALLYHLQKNATTTPTATAQQVTSSA